MSLITVDCMLICVAKHCVLRCWHKLLRWFLSILSVVNFCLLLVVFVGHVNSK